MKVFNGLNFTGTSITNVVMDPLTADIGSPAAGQFWFRTDTGVPRIYDGTTTQTIAYLSDITAGSIAGSLFDAHTILYAAADDTPLPLTMGASTIFGRGATGDAAALTPAQVRTIINVEDGATADQTAAEVVVTPAGNVSATDVQAALVAGVADGSVVTARLANNAVTLGKMATMATASFIGRDTAGTGDPEVLSAAEARAVLNVEDNAAADQTAAEVPFTPAGNIAATDVQAAIAELDTEKLDASAVPVPTSTAPVATNTAAVVGTSTEYARQDHVHTLADDVVVTAKIADSNVTLAKIADIADDTMLGNVTGAAAAPAALTPAQIRTMINVEDNAAADQTAAEVPFTPAGTIAATNVQAAIQELDGEITTQIAALVDSSPAALDTLNELAAAIGDDANFSTTMTNALALRTQKFAAAFGDGASTSYTITHGLNTEDFTISVREVAGGAGVIVDWAPSGVNDVDITVAVAPAANSLRVVVVG